MATTRIAGITIDRIGRRTINKEYRGVRVFLRLGTVCQEHAERRLAQEIERLESEAERWAHARPLFSDCCNLWVANSHLSGDWELKRAATVLPPSVTIKRGRNDR